ncbi:unnamed protein product [Cylicocyclus nassatus]|uniref:Uncharacterized protein n=1 Tax=Cylicocyclus nassatus TaxID=53992 RepID=A0AA36GGS0_CYLNA|nr:unnamed protein product [Cylicocyclus nassatus]
MRSGSTKTEIEGVAAKPQSPPMVQLPQGVLADYPQYNPHMLLRLTQTYDLLTPPPAVPLPVLKQPALVVTRNEQTEPMN